MSNKALDWAYKQNLKSPLKPVLVALANRANNNTFTAWPSIETLAFDVGMSISTIMRATKQLIKHGLISKKPKLNELKQRSHNVYTLHLNISLPCVMVTDGSTQEPNVNLIESTCHGDTQTIREPVSIPSTKKIDHSNSINNYSCKDLSESLANQAEQVASYLLPKGKKVGSEWKVGNVYGEEGSSLGIHLTGSKAGVWCDFATGESGDLIDLWQAVRSLNKADALFEIKRWLGLPENTVKPIEKSFKRPIKSYKPIEDNPSALNYLLLERKLSFQTLKNFNIGATRNEIALPYYRDNELIQIKYLHLTRQNGKKRFRSEKDCQPCLFGWQTIPKNSQNIALTEGEIDAMSLFQSGIPALSLPFGGGEGGKQAWLDYELERLNRFNQIILCLDQDELGSTTVKFLQQKLGKDRCKVMNLPYKDANACLQNNLTAYEIQEYLNNALLSHNHEEK